MYICTTVKKNPGSLTPQRFMLIRGLTNVNETCEAPTRNPEMQTCKSLKPILDGQSLANQGALYYPHLPVPYIIPTYTYIYIYIHDIWNQGSIVTWYIGLPGSLVPNRLGTGRWGLPSQTMHYSGEIAQNDHTFVSIYHLIPILIL